MKVIINNPNVFPLRKSNKVVNDYRTILVIKPSDFNSFNSELIKELKFDLVLIPEEFNKFFMKSEMYEELLPKTKEFIYY